MKTNRVRTVESAAPPSAEFILARLKEGSFAQSAYMPMLPGEFAAVWVDNRKGEAGELGLGGARVPVAAGRAAMADVDICDTPTPVTYDGVSIGEIPAVSTTSGAQPFIWVDPTGSRCYKLYSVTYAPQSEGGGGRSGAELWSGRKLYFSPDSVAYVFTRPPAETFGYSNERPTRQVVEDAKCGPRR